MTTLKRELRTMFEEVLTARAGDLPETVADELAEKAIELRGFKMLGTDEYRPVYVVADDTPLPKTPKQAVEHPDIMVFEKICGRIPGDRDYALVIDTIRFLRGKHRDQLVEKVTPYWLAWSGRKSKDGKKYNPATLVWLTEWAVNDELPDDGPKPGINVASIEETQKRLDENYVPKSTSGIPAELNDSVRAKLAQKNKRTK